jgi:hypothetical protein
MSFPRLNIRRYSPDEGAGAAFAKYFLAKKGTDGSAEGGGCWSRRRTAGKQRWGSALASSRQPCESFKSPWGRGLMQRRTEEGRSRRRGTVWRRRSLESPADGKARYGGLLENIHVPTIFCGPATRSLCSTNPSPSRYPAIDSVPATVPGVIVTAHC